MEDQENQNEGGPAMKEDNNTMYIQFNISTMTLKHDHGHHNDTIHRRSSHYHLDLVLVVSQGLDVALVLIIIIVIMRYNNHITVSPALNTSITMTILIPDSDNNTSKNNNIITNHIKDFFQVLHLLVSIRFREVGPSRQILSLLIARYTT